MKRCRPGQSSPRRRVFKVFCSLFLFCRSLNSPRKETLSPWSKFSTRQCLEIICSPLMPILKVIDQTVRVKFVNRNCPRKSNLKVIGQTFCGSVVACCQRWCLRAGGVLKLRPVPDTERSIKIQTFYHTSPPPDANILLWPVCFVLQLSVDRFKVDRFKRTKQNWLRLNEP